MCGIVSYIGHGKAQKILLDGLERLSYRGYDSAGIAVMGENGKLSVRKTTGKINQLKKLVEETPLTGCAGIGHTRWATHGEPSERNAHPHMNSSGTIAVVHNGVIENAEELRKQLKEQGTRFVSQTDTEVLVHLLDQLYRDDMLRALTELKKVLKGSYAVAVICEQEPERIYCVKSGSPLVVGSRSGECFAASDIPALLPYVWDVIVLEDGQTGVLTANDVQIYDQNGQLCSKQLLHVDWDQKSAEKGGYDHYMLKEIHEQPSALRNTVASRSDPKDFEWLPITPNEACKIQKITIAACGTAYHAGVMAKYALETLARIPAEAALASEYSMHTPVSQENEWFIAVSQSGETADTLAALRKAKENGLKVLAICNTVGSTMTREAGETNTLYTYAGPEIAVASTKAYVTQTELMIMLAAALGAMRGTLTSEQMEALYDALKKLPDQMREVLKTEKQMRAIAAEMQNSDHVFFIGRGMDYALAMEASLKLKEISYLYSEAYAAGELKHGPIALLHNGSLVVAIITQPHVLDKMIVNLQEIRARGAVVVAVCVSKLARRVELYADEMVVIPDSQACLAPLLAAVPLQLFAYCMAVNRGCDVDQPRNLAKSVTVE